MPDDISRVDAPVSIDPAAAFARAEELERVGRTAEAEQIYRSLLRLYPDHPWLLNSLALMLKARGEPGHAENLLRRAISQMPREPVFHNNLGNLLRARNNLAEAESAYRYAFSLKAAYPEAHYNLGVTLEEMGREDEALTVYRYAVTLKPDYAQALTRVGSILNRRNAYAEALVELDKAVAANPNYFDAQYYRGLVLDGLERFEAAMAAFERALSLRPDSPEVLCNLALTAARRSDTAQARAYAARCLAVSPVQPIAEVALAMVDLAEHAFTQAEQRLTLLLANQQVQGNVRAFAHGLLGDALDGQKMFAKAFASYVAENEELLRLYASRFAGHRSTAEVRSMIAYFEATPAYSWKPAEEAPSTGNAIQHVFLVGFMRSGTTLLEQVLASHPSVVTLEEYDAFGDASDLFLSNEDGMNHLAELKGSELTPYRDMYWQQVRNYGVNVEGKVFVNKHPLNTLKLPLVAKLFPKAKVLFAVRDPRDVVLSCFRRHFGINAATFELLTLQSAAQFYDSVMRLAALYRAKLPLDLRETRYEDMITDFDTHVKAVCQYLGIEWVEEMRNFSNVARTRSIRSVSAEQVRRSLYSEGIGQWRNYVTELSPALPLLESWVKAFNYV